MGGVADIPWTYRSLFLLIRSHKSGSTNDRRQVRHGRPPKRPRASQRGRGRQAVEKLPWCLLLPPNRAPNGTKHAAFGALRARFEAADRSAATFSTGWGVLRASYFSNSRKLSKFSSRSHPIHIFTPSTPPKSQLEGRR